MGCSSCGGGGTPGGCKNNGTCSSGGCSKLEVYDWLANMESPNGQAPYDIIEIRFKNSRKGFFRNTKNLTLQVGDVVVVEGSPGKDVGVVSVVGELARIQVKKKSPGFKPMEASKIFGIAEQADIDKWISARSLEKDAMYQARTLALNLKLAMKISDVEYQADLSKATFYYTAEDRIDFRQLIKDMADVFKVRIEMRQIGARQEAARLGGIGSCGRELCCSTWLTDFRSVSTSAARYQQLSLNPQKLAGQCGKLKCCLNYELDMYLDAIKAFPKGDLKLKTDKGTAAYIKTDVFKKQMWYVYEGESNSGLIPVHPDRVREIIRMNKDGKKPHDLIEFSEVTIAKEPDYTNVVGQDSLNRFDKLFKKKKKKGGGNRNNPKGQREKQGGEANKPGEKRRPNPRKSNPNQTKSGGEQNANAPKAEGGNNSNKRRNNRRKRPDNDQNKNNETPK
ncbi:MAG: cell fate regulator YaaT (PSP1 superfamily) [Crocinitomicaceae bacterium]|jgi:cell fate regulator YaaT (PSP1 superfamily)